MMLWNQKNLPAPPTNTYKSKTKDLDLVKFRNALQDCIKHFKNENFMIKEAALLSRVIYRMKMKFHSSKEFKSLEKINHSLNNYLNTNMIHSLNDILSLIPLTYRKETYLPTRNMLNYILVRIQGLVKLMERIYDLCQVAALEISAKIAIGHFWKMYIVLFALVSRIFILVKFNTKYLCELYGKLLPHSKKLENIGRNWLPEEYELPCDLRIWLGVQWVYEAEFIDLTFEPTMKIIDFFNLVDDDDDDDVQFCDEYILVDKDDINIAKDFKKLRPVKETFTTNRMRGFSINEDDIGEELSDILGFTTTVNSLENTKNDRKKDGHSDEPNKLLQVEEIGEEIEYNSLDSLKIIDLDEAEYNVNHVSVSKMKKHTNNNNTKSKQSLKEGLSKKAKKKIKKTKNNRVSRISDDSIILQDSENIELPKKKMVNIIELNDSPVEEEVTSEYTKFDREMVSHPNDIREGIAGTEDSSKDRLKCLNLDKTKRNLNLSRSYIENNNAEVNDIAVKELPSKYINDKRLRPHSDDPNKMSETEDTEKEISARENYSEGKLKVINLDETECSLNISANRMKSFTSSTVETGSHSNAVKENLEDNSHSESKYPKSLSKKKKKLVNKNKKMTVSRLASGIISKNNESIGCLEKDVLNITSFIDADAEDLVTKINETITKNKQVLKSHSNNTDKNSEIEQIREKISDETNSIRELTMDETGPNFNTPISKIKNSKGSKKKRKKITNDNNTNITSSTIYNHISKDNNSEKNIAYISKLIHADVKKLSFKIRKTIHKTKKILNSPFTNKHNNSEFEDIGKEMIENSFNDRLKVANLGKLNDTIYEEITSDDKKMRLHCNERNMNWDVEDVGDCFEKNNSSDNKSKMRNLGEIKKFNENNSINLNKSLFKTPKKKLRKMMKRSNNNTNVNLSDINIISKDGDFISEIIKIPDTPVKNTHNNLENTSVDNTVDNSLTTSKTLFNNALNLSKVERNKFVFRSDNTNLDSNSSTSQMPQCHLTKVKLEEKLEASKCKQTEESKNLTMDRNEIPLKRKLINDDSGQIIKKSKKERQKDIIFGENNVRKKAIKKERREKKIQKTKKEKQPKQNTDVRGREDPFNSSEQEFNSTLSKIQKFLKNPKKYSKDLEKNSDKIDSNIINPTEDKELKFDKENIVRLSLLAEKTKLIPTLETPLKATLIIDKIPMNKGDKNSSREAPEQNVQNILEDTSNESLARYSEIKSKQINHDMSHKMTKQAVKFREKINNEEKASCSVVAPKQHHNQSSEKSQTTLKNNKKLMEKNRPSASKKTCDNRNISVIEISDDEVSEKQNSSRETCENNNKSMNNETKYIPHSEPKPKKSILVSKSKKQKKKKEPQVVSKFFRR